MGFAFCYNLFYSNAESVWKAFASFYTQPVSSFHVPGADDRTIDIYNEHNGWVVVDLGGGWELKVSREAQLFVSRTLLCPGFLVFVYDGNYWGYEFFDRGEVKDHFVQYPNPEPIGFPGEDCRGNADVVARHLPFLRVEDIAPYLVLKEGDWDIDPRGINVPARPGDEFRRFDECAVLDFLRMLGVPVELRDKYVRLNVRGYRDLRVT